MHNLCIASCIGICTLLALSISKAKGGSRHPTLHARPWRMCPNEGMDLSLGLSPLHPTEAANAHADMHQRYIIHLLIQLSLVGSWSSGKPLLIVYARTVLQKTISPIRKYI
ncbi:uncharacterized protein BP01DRAFT_102095 [Aspergillus saccharolyticus JOP 1030-1]|uniref:Secreted protein n=1 Tax=Aspergillus saccharolyticus JOP 1030-1 TaxID=1450539 RepID=A0A319A8B6_9EURO|nr:hypothetical protein BP01DRAFT_102095 [Aspergillus saccharolyticus JOP 1030-1]PYH43332.1 hypothetical protein BP01DRAFT_102095 [Aspergillus saccharolyticus JOP 1030-1]